MPANIAGRSLAFKTIQYYSNGKVIHWIGPPSAEYPAPTINVTAKGGVVQEVAGGEAGPVAGEVPGAQGAATPREDLKPLAIGQTHAGARILHVRGSPTGC
jgi:hypothetical protein